MLLKTLIAHFMYIVNLYAYFYYVKHNKYLFCTLIFPARENQQEVQEAYFSLENQNKTKKIF